MYLAAPAKLDKLAPMSFIGAAAVAFYKTKTKVMTQLKMTEAQRKATLSDGQEAGEMLLDIEERIGELYEGLPSAEGKLGKGKSSTAVPADNCHVHADVF
jgi:hypothetical protein